MSGKEKGSALRSPFLVHDLSKYLFILLRHRHSLIDQIFQSDKGLFRRHSADWTGCVHRSVNGSASVNQELHRLNVLAVFVIPVPRIKSGYLIPGNAVRYRHGKSILVSHLYGGFHIVRRRRDYGDSEFLQFVFLQFKAGQMPAAKLSPTAAIEK